MRRISWLLLLCAAGCIHESPDYPMDKPGTWHLPETSANDANLRTMIVDPNDLVAGKGESTTIGVEAGPPVQRLVTGQRYPLPASDIGELSITNSGQQQSQPSQGGQNVQ
jgi:hypothetical protein